MNGEELLKGLIDKFADGSYELAAHYASCDICSVVGIAVDYECDQGLKIADDLFRKRSA